MNLRANLKNTFFLIKYSNIGKGLAISIKQIGLNLKTRNFSGGI